jgi:hypothetical protein
VKDEAKARLKKARLEKARLEKARLKKARLEKARLKKARLEKAGLNKARLEKARLKKARLEKARLKKARLEKAGLKKARLEKARLSVVVGGGKRGGLTGCNVMLSLREVEEWTVTRCLLYDHGLPREVCFRAWGTKPLLWAVDCVYCNRFSAR